jgi:hypothetical protein
MEVPVFIQNINWELLKEQKQSLIAVISEYDNDYPKEAIVIKERLKHIEGILNLIDALQDFAVEEMGIDEKLVFNLSDDGEEPTESEYDIFANANADIIFSMHIEGSSLYDNETMSKEFIESIVDDKSHADIIKIIIRDTILNDLASNPDSFSRDENGNLTYDVSMYDYGYEIETYCEKIYNQRFPQSKKTYRVCPHCGSKNVQQKAWTRPNENNKFVDYPEGDDGNDFWCDDCEEHGVFISSENLVGFQVVDSDNNIHPKMDASFCLYNRTQAIEMIANSKKWKLLAIMDGDVEEPTLMFEGNPLH